MSRMLAISFHWILKLVFVALLLKVGKMQKCKNACDRSKTFNSRGNLAIAIDWFCEECKKEETLTFACFEFWLQFSPCGKLIIILLVKVLSTPCLQILTSSDILKDISFSYLRLTIGGGGEDKNSGPFSRFDDNKTLTKPYCFCLVVFVAGRRALSFCEDIELGRLLVAWTAWEIVFFHLCSVTYINEKWTLDFFLFLKI